MSNSEKTSKLFMSFSTGQETKEVKPFKKYIGIAPAKILAVNPTAQELANIYSNEPGEEIVYVGQTEVNGQMVPQVRIDFIVEADVNKEETFKTRVSFFINGTRRFNKDQTKVQVIDKYGETAWATQEDVQNKTIPMYSNGPANIDADFRPAYSGEIELTEFIKAYLNIPAPRTWNKTNRVWVDKPEEEKKNSEARFDSLDKLIKGDVKQLRDIIGFQPNNKIKLMFGIRTTDDNNQYQAVYNRGFLRANSTNYDRIAKELQSALDAGAFSTTEFSATPLREYNVEATDFGNTKSDVDPFASTDSPADPW